MFERFGSYPDITWHAAAAAQFIGKGDKIQINPDLENFRLERFKDLRKHLATDKERRLKLMLVDTRSKTNIFIGGPDLQIDAIIERVPKYKDKSWIEIKNMSLERDTISCKNSFLSMCDPWIVENMGIDEAIPGQPSREFDSSKANEICSQCKYFELE